MWFVTTLPDGPPGCRLSTRRRPGGLRGLRALAQTHPAQPLVLVDVVEQEQSAQRGLLGGQLPGNSKLMDPLRGDSKPTCGLA